LGVNRFAFHVFGHNPWIDKKPGMTLNSIGLYFQRDQTWWKHGKSWMEYLERCNALLQQGKPIVDIAVFTGEEYPRRALTPDRLINILPGLFGNDVLEQEKNRLQNNGIPMIERPYSVKNAANTYDPAKWIDPLNGYKYDSFNKDALLNLAIVKDGKILLDGGQTYSTLVVPAPGKGAPNNILSNETADKLCELIEAGATIIIEKRDTSGILAFNNAKGESTKKLFQVNDNANEKQLGKGKIIYAPFYDESLNDLGIERDFIAEENGIQVNDIAWTHRGNDEFNIYFISNQQETERKLSISFRVTDKQPGIYVPASGEIIESIIYKPIQTNSHETY
jgi:hypothetical protein